MRSALAGAILAAALLAPAAAEEPPAPPALPAAPAPPEPVPEDLHGLRVDVVVPPGDPPPEGRSLLVFLHGRTTTGKDGARKLAPLALRGFVVAAPWAKTGDWTAKEMDAVRLVARDLAARHSVPPGRLHAAGFWTGAELLPALAFDESLRFRTATWIDFAWSGGSVPKRAKEGMRGLFLWGAREGPSRIDRYRKAADLLAHKVEVALARGEPPADALGRGRSEDPEIPLGLLPFWTAFLEAAEGRSPPGGGGAFDWLPTLGDAVPEMVARDAGGFVYVFDPKAAGEERERMRALEDGVFWDPLVRRFAEQLVAVRLEKSAAGELMKEAKVEGTPALVVFRKGGGEVLRVLQGEIAAKALVPALRAAAPDPSMPK